jgi:serine/threonine-protein kinase
MANDCISRERMSEFLAGSLLPEDESQITEHLHGCGDCNQLAFELSDEPAARKILAGAANHDVRRGGEAALVDLQRRLAALALIESAFSDTATLQSGETPSVSTGKWHAEDISSPLPERLGKFEIIRELGAGSFGIVYLAKDTVLNRHVALKLPRSIRLVDPGGQQRFFREAQALARLDHPHIVPLYEAGEHDGTCYLAVAYCNGPTLDKWRRQQGGLIEPQNAAEIVLLLAEAVEHAHQQGILHRDIKPANVLLTKVQGSNSKLNEDPNSTRLQTLDLGQWTPKLADFGLAKMSDDQHSSSTVSGTVLGTPDYLSPEQAAGMLDQIGPPTDVYGLGAILYELLTGQPPLHGASTADTLRRVLVDEPRPPRELASGVAPELEAIVMK